MRSLLLLSFVALSLGIILQKPNEGIWIVVFHSNSSSMERDSHYARFQPIIQHQYEIGTFFGYAAYMNGSMVEAVKRSEEVSFVEEDRIMSIDQACTKQTSATWGLNRIDERALKLDGIYAYSATGANTNAYIVDTGIYIGNLDFEGRAIFGANFANDGNNNDCNGHGTHVAGTVGSKTWGVAKKTTLIAVKVLACNGQGTNAGVIAGVNYVATDAKKRGKPAVANMSLGGGYSAALNKAVASSVTAGVSFVVAAGNENTDACNSSPASEPQSICVGATDKTDSRSSFSNFGPCTDIFAPGSDITSTWIGSPTATNTISGTSMASPHVAGAVAQILSARPTATPTVVRDTLLSSTTAGVLKLACKTTSCNSSPNRLLYSACS